MWAEEVNESDKSIVNAFVRGVLALDIDDIVLKQYSRRFLEKFPLHWGINYRCYEFENIINDSKKLRHTLYIDVDKKYVFDYSTQILYKVGNEYILDMGRVKNDRVENLLAIEDTFTKVNVILKYLNKKDEDIKQYNIKENEEYDEIEFWKPTLYENIPCRYREFKVCVSRRNGRICNFYYAFPMAPANKKPPITNANIEEIIKVVQQWAKGHVYFSKFSMEIDKSKDIQLVIAPAIDVFNVKKEGERKEFYYAWEVPIKWNEYAEREGMVWIESWNNEVIGSAPNRFQKVRSRNTVGMNMGSDLIYYRDKEAIGVQE